jgi:hypothetical protein
MKQLEGVVNVLGEPALNKKKPEGVKGEATRTNGESTGVLKVLPLEGRPKAPAPS